MRKVLVLGILVCSLGACCAAQNAASDNVPSKDDVLKFIEVLRLRPQLVQYFDGVGKQAKLGAEQGFKQKIPDATPEQLAEVDKFAESIFKNMPIDEMIEAMVPIYQKHLTKEDIDGILAFYASPVGQKLQREQPAMMAEGMQAGGEIGRRRIGTMIQQMNDFVSKLAEQQDHKATKPPQ